MNSDTVQPTTRRGVLLTTDLLFSTKVTGTASALGQEVAVAGNVAKAVELCRARPCTYVIIDLGMAEIEMETAVTQLREAAGAVPTIAYGWRMGLSTTIHIFAPRTQAHEQTRSHRIRTRCPGFLRAR